MKQQLYIISKMNIDGKEVEAPVPISNPCTLIAENSRAMLHIVNIPEESKRDIDWSGFLITGKDSGISSPIRSDSEAYRLYVSLEKKHCSHEDFLKKMKTQYSIARVNICDMKFDFNIGNGNEKSGQD